MGGRDKGLVELDKTPFIQRLLDLVSPFSDDLIISCNRNMEIYARYGVTLVQDANNNFQGPLAGILAGMRQARHSNLLVLPCDTPYLPKELPIRLFKAHQQTPQAVTLVNDGERQQPLHAILPTRLKDDLASYLEQGQRAVMGWYSRHPLNTVDLSNDTGAFININRQSELDALQPKAEN